MSDAVGMADAAVRDWIDAAAGRLAMGGYQEVAPPAGMTTHVRIFRRRQLRVTWFFTRMHTFVVLQAATSAVTIASFWSFVHATTAFASAAKGGLPLGLQTGVIVMPVLVSSQISPDVQHSARSRPAVGLGLVCAPIAVDASARRAYTFAGRLLFGLIFSSHLGAQQRLILSDIDADTIPGLGKDPVSLALLLAFWAMVLGGLAIAVASVLS